MCISSVRGSNSKDHKLVLISTSTGMKCLPSHKVPQAQGFVLHDWHAEILAIRGFNHYLLQECHRLAQSNECTSTFIRWRNEGERSLSRGLQPFTIQERVKIYMYCSEAPCGDASMELTMGNQEDATPWVVIPAVDDANQANVLKGRGYFSELGIVRRKPCMFSFSALPPILIFHR